MAWYRGILALAAAMVPASVICSSRAHAAAWTQPPDAVYFKLTQRLLVGQGGYLRDGTVVTFSEPFIDTSLGFYGELGLRPGLTVVLYGRPFGYATFAGASTPYMGPLGAGVRTGETFGPLVAAFEGRYGYAPDFGEAVLVRGNDWAYIPAVETHLLEAEAQAGLSLFGHGWATATVGVRYGSAPGYGLVSIGGAQLGWNLPANITLEGHLSWVLPQDPVPLSNISGAGPTRYVGFGVSSSFWFHPSWAIYLGVEGAAFVAANAATPSITFGVEFRRQGIEQPSGHNEAVPAPGEEP